MRFRLFIASAALLASSAYAQAPAIEVPPMRPPLVRPVVNPPSFPTPGATPAGAGIVVPTPEGGEQVVPRSPNKRILPATKEPGLWAADGAPTAGLNVGKVNVLGLVLDFGPDLKAWDVAGECASDINEASSIPDRWHPIVSAFSEGAKQCISAKLLLYCVTLTKDELQQGSRMFTRLRLAGALEAERKAEEMVRHYCGDKQLNYTQGDYMSAIRSVWGSVHRRRLKQEEGK